MPSPSDRVQASNGSTPATPPEHAPRQRASEPDVFLSVPELHVDEIRLAVDNLDAHVALQARLANLLELRAGADVSIEKVELDIKGVDAKATLKVRLENVHGILDRTLTSIDRNPQILEGVIETAHEVVKPEGLLAEAVDGITGPLRSRRRARKLAAAGRKGARKLRKAIDAIT